jgi:flagellar basal body-associated protein FliL
MGKSIRKVWNQTSIFIFLVMVLIVLAIGIYLLINAKQKNESNRGTYVLQEYEQEYAEEGFYGKTNQQT